MLPRDQSETNSDSSHEVRILILGAGAVVTEFYLPALAWLGESWKTTVVDLSSQALQKVREKAPWVVTCQQGFEEAIRSNDGVDFVVVALPNWLHVKACEVAMNAGLPVLCEKPLALTKAECMRLDNVSAATDVPLEVAMVRRLTPANQSAAAVIRSGVLGPLSKVIVEHGSPYGWLSDSGAFFRKENGGILADLGVHQLDWLSSILGPLTPVSYTDDAAGGLEASCEYRLQTQDEIDIEMKMSYRYQYSNKTVFVGDQAELHVDRNDFEKCRIVGLVANAKTEVSAEKPFDDTLLRHNFESCFVQQLVDFAKVIRKEKPVRVSAGEAAQTIRLIEFAYNGRTKTLNVSSNAKDQGDLHSERRPALHAGRTVVTGGTGFIGGHLLERLAELGFSDVVVPVRNFRTCVNAARFPVQLMRSDLSNRDQVRTIVKDARWVFHLAYGQTESDSKTITVDATKLLVEEAVREGVEAVVVLSTMGVFGHPETDQLIDETFAYAPAYGDYGKTKAEMEKWLLSPDRQYGKTRVIVLNPSCVYGPEGKTYTRLPYELASRGEFAWVEGGRGIANYVYVQNLVDAILLVAADKRAHRNRYLVNDGWCTWKEFLTPLLGPLANTVPDLSQVQFQVSPTRTEMQVRSIDVVRHLASDYKFVDLLNRHSVLGPTKKLALKLGRKKLEQLRIAPLRQRASYTSTQSQQPQPWLPEVFGRTSARFNSEKLRSLGWTSAVVIEQGLEITTQWLSDVDQQFRSEEPT